jgi:hypothetical protein
MGDCRACIHHRMKHRMSDALADDCGAFSEPAHDALAQMRKEERDLQVSELSEKKELMLRDCVRWPQQPRMTDYCAVHEDQNIFYICDLKNAGGKCGHFFPGSLPVRGCSTCVHRAAPFGRERDLKIAQVYMTAVAAMPMFQNANQQMLAQHESSCAKSMANQMNLAFFSGGHLPRRPEYLSVCRAFSETENYSLCVFQNASGTCKHWKGKSGGGHGSGVLELKSDQRDWVEVSGVELSRDGANLNVRYPDPEWGPPRLASYDLRSLSADGASQLALPDGTRLPMLARLVNCVLYIRTGVSDDGAAYPRLLPAGRRDKKIFRVYPSQRYEHPSQAFSVTVCGSSLLVYGDLGIPTSVDLSQTPPNTWMTPVVKDYKLPLQFRLDWTDYLCKAYVPWVEWLE